MKKLNILIVDDLHLNVYSLRLMIEEYFDVNIYEAQSASDALDTLLENEIDLIISDIQMPLIDGFEFSRYLKSIHSLKDIPIILSSGIYCDNEVKEKIKELNILKFLPKPIDYDELNSTLNDLIYYNDYLEAN